MDLKAVMISRGEIILVVVVALACAFYVYSVYGDSASQPKADEAKIDGEFAAIEEASSRDAPRPEPRVPADSLRAMLKRLNAQEPAPVMTQWLGRHPNVIKADDDDTPDFLYAYQILAPSIEATAAVGSFDITLNAPAQVETGDQRLGAGGDWSAQRKVPGGEPVVNSARVVAIQVEERHGGVDRPWNPVGEMGNQGLLLLSAGESVSKVLNQVQSGQDYWYRARVLVAATGFSEGAGVKQAVIVYRGLLEEKPDWSQFADDKRNGHYLKLATDVDPEAPSLAEKLGRGLPGVSLSTSESIYIGPWCDPVAVTQPTDFRLGLQAISDFNGEVSARVYLRKLLRGLDNEPIGWTDSVRFTVKKGEKLGGPHVIVVNERKTEVDLSTTLELLGVEKDVERVLYYEVDDKNNEEGKRVLVLEPKVKTVDIAKFKDTSTGKAVNLIKLQRISWRSGDIIYPQYAGEGSYDERAGLDAADPSDYESPMAPQALTVDEPIWHEKDDPLLWQHDKLAQTDQRYLEFADGRLVYYDHINRKIFVVDMTPEDVVEPALPEGGDAAGEGAVAPDSDDMGVAP